VFDKLLEKCIKETELPKIQQKFLDAYMKLPTQHAIDDGFIFSDGTFVKMLRSHDYTISRTGVNAHKFYSSGVVSTIVSQPSELDIRFDLGRAPNASQIRTIGRLLGSRRTMYVDINVDGRLPKSYKFGVYKIGRNDVLDLLRDFKKGILINAEPYLVGVL